MGILQRNALDAAIIRVNAGGNGIVENFNPWFSKNTLLKNATPPKGIPPVDEINLPGDFGKVKSVLQSSISTTDNRNSFIAEKETVA